MKYAEVVEKAKQIRNAPYGYGKVQYLPCKEWLAGEHINLWTYWQGYQLEDIDEHGVDVLLVGQDWGNPERNPDVIRRIKEMQNGNKTFRYNSTISPTDKVMKEMFKAFGEQVDIDSVNPGMRLFFTNYSLGYRQGSETGGMTKRLMRKDKELFDDLVEAIHPKIIICLGKLTYEMVAGEVTRKFSEQLQGGKPFKTLFPLDPTISVYGVAHCGSRGLQNVGGIENMKAAWEKIAEEYWALS